MFERLRVAPDIVGREEKAPLHFKRSALIYTDPK